ncbi:MULTISPECIES: HAD family hydrolase [Pseudomonas]|uniref:Haloacid dehalogenase superfamily, subfamily IA, variant 1 with third motif having Dx(3-4)D or Dx(3-4)E n=1 Tax=Pseudomonas trivialis TaxID=200450 RepID=A0A0R2ZH99_9PSED|nr:HAD-IA family hydrolase [Pseudomonas trivialis]KRP60167.1 hypothetical protein TU79_13465 [Pseudomonas trivialis]MEE4183099.1 HAD-IA family hydrolase [Pseudomonas viridiflava]SDS59618.1 haloacid dehalogenase superfamily, subfamily IA, variant 1 with third motif having Dx(3-4)D or Dx(3-4)E [Pseudomonas trivialis]
MVTAAVIFDLFGTVLEIQDRQNPYRRLLRMGAEQGRSASPGDMRVIMKLSGGLKEAAATLGITLSPWALAELEHALEVELASVRIFDDALAAIDLLRASGIKIAVCSNLAAPYCDVARRLLPDLDGYALSAELGVMKPDPMIYRSVCSLLGLEHAIDTKQGQVIMVGDSKKCDERGPRVCGIQGFHLDRAGGGRFINLVEFYNEIVTQN